MRSLLICLLLSITGTARSTDYLVYHELVNRAEYHIVSNNVDSGLACYDKAFAAFDYIFPKDALTAAQFAWKNLNKDKAIDYLVKGSKSGLRSTCLNNCPILASFMDGAWFQSVFDSMKAGNYEYNKKLDPALRDEWQQRVDALVMTHSEIGDFITVVEENMSRMKELLKTGKYPGVRYLGPVTDCRMLGNNNAYYTLINYECVVSELYQELWQAVKNGELHPREFGRLCDWEYIRTKRSMKMHSREVMQTVFAKLTTYATKDNEYIMMNRACDKKKQQLRRLNLVMSYIDDTSAVEINKQRAACYVTSLEVDEKKKQLEQTERYVFFFGTH